MFQQEGTGGFQRGFEGIQVPPFQRGSSFLTMGEDNTKWQSNQRVYYPFCCIPLNNVTTNSTYLEKNYVFAWSTDDISDVSFESPDNIFQQTFISGPTIDGFNHNSWLGRGKGTVILALNLPLVNYMLMKQCNDTVPGEIDPKFIGCKEIEPWVIPPIETIVKKIWPVGPNITTKEAALYGYVSRNIGLYGMGDTRAIWACTMWQNNRNNQFQMIKTGSRVGFMCYPVLASSYRHPERFDYVIDAETTHSVDNTKEVFWKVVPILCGDDEYMKNMEAKYSVTKTFSILSQNPFKNDDGEMHDRVLHTIVYKPYIWKVGVIAEPAASHATNATGTRLDVLRIGSDPTVDYNALAMLPVFQLDADSLGPSCRGVRSSIRGRRRLTDDETYSNRFHHHMLFDKT